jgi:hypothetical protein
MPGSKAVKERIEQLIAQAEGLSVGFDYPGQTAWLTAAQHAVELVCPSDTNPYCKGARDQVTAGVSSAREAVSGMAALMSRLLEEINGGLLTTSRTTRSPSPLTTSSIMAPSTSGMAERMRPLSLRALCSRTRSGASAACWASPRTASHWTR